VRILVTLLRKRFYHRKATWLLSVAIIASGFSQTNPNVTKMPVAVFTACPYGFDPPLIEHSAGRIMLAVYNRSGLKLTTFRLDQQGRGRAHDLDIKPDRQDWHELVELPAGTYILSEATHTKWSAKLVLK
jgi:hypothetical protein